MAPLWPSVKMVFLLFRDGLEKKPAARSQEASGHGRASLSSMTRFLLHSTMMHSWSLFLLLMFDFFFLYLNGAELGSINKTDLTFK